jgi:hypothetical protein
MLKLNVFQFQNPLETQEIALLPDHLADGEFSIGRMPHCNLALANSDVSHQHAKIVLLRWDLRLCRPEQFWGFLAERSAGDRAPAIPAQLRRSMDPSGSSPVLQIQPKNYC